MTRIKGRPGTGLIRWLSAPVDIGSLAAFRLLFGLLMAAGMIRFLAKGWVTELYVLPKFHFAYDGFGWIRVLPPGWMHAHFVMLTLLALMVAAGFCYRPALILFLLGFTYVELIDQTAYLNHYYLVTLLSGLMIFLPAHAAGSIDALLRPALRQSTVPAWSIHLLRFQLAVVYLFAGLAKVNADWLLQAQPLRIWLAARSDAPWLGPWLEPVWVAYAASWVGAAYDLTIVFFLLNARTRRFAFAAVVIFHVGTWLLFNIGMFPWIMIAATTLFFRPDWPRPLLTCVAAPLGKIGGLGRAWTPRATRAEPTTEAPPLRKPGRLVAALALYAAVQLLLPLRPYCWGDGHPAWSYRGFNLSWQVMVAEKTGYVEFYARDPGTGKRSRIQVRDYLTPRQEALMAQDPFLIRAFARKLSADLNGHGSNRAQIVVNAYATLNGRPGQRIIDPDADLVEIAGSDWLVPLVEN